MSLSGGIPGLAVHPGLQYGMRDDLAPKSKRMWVEPKFPTLKIAHIPLPHLHTDTPWVGDVYGHAVLKKLVAAVCNLTLVTLPLFGGP